VQIRVARISRVACSCNPGQTTAATNRLQQTKFAIVQHLGLVKAALHGWVALIGETSDQRDSANQQTPLDRDQGPRQLEPDGLVLILAVRPITLLRRG
jgi:hypothetical protein